MAKEERKIIIDYFWAYHCMGKGLLDKDHIRISKDLRKIAKIPFMAESSPHESVFPFRLVQIITDSNRNELKGLPKKISKEIPKNVSTYETGRLLGYKLLDYSWGSVDKEEMDKWYNNARYYQNYGRKEAERIFTLSELDKL